VTATTTDGGAARHERRLALPVAVGLWLFLGGGRLVGVLATVSGPGADDAQAGLVVGSAVLTYGGAVVVAVGALALARRLLAHQLTGETVTAHPSRPRRHRSALAGVVAGLVLMAASQLAVELSFVLEDGYFPGAGLGELGVVVATAGTYLGPLVTAVGTFVSVRGLEDASTARRSEVPPPDVTDLDAWRRPPRRPHSSLSASAHHWPTFAGHRRKNRA